MVTGSTRAKRSAATVALLVTPAVPPRLVNAPAAPAIKLGGHTHLRRRVPCPVSSPVVQSTRTQRDRDCDRLLRGRRIGEYEAALPHPQTRTLRVRHRLHAHESRDVANDGKVVRDEDQSFVRCSTRSTEFPVSLNSRIYECICEHLSSEDGGTIEC